MHEELKDAHGTSGCSFTMRVVAGPKLWCKLDAEIIKP